MSLFKKFIVENKFGIKPPYQIKFIVENKFIWYKTRMISRIILLTLVLTTLTLGIKIHVVDYAVIGSGAGGSVAATELAKNGSTVLVLERGQDWTELSDSCLRFYGGLATNCTRPEWLSPKIVLANYIDTLETNGGLPLFEPIPFVAGGAQSLNGEAYDRLSEADMAAWNSSLWTFEATLDDFKELETAENSDPTYHGTGGPIKTTRFELDSVMQNLLDTMVNQMGIPYNPDLSGPDSHGVGQMYRNIGQDNGDDFLSRQSGYEKILKPALDMPNLELILGADVFQVIPHKRAPRVKFFLDGEIHTVIVKKEIIISAGTFGSAKLLQLSGIGDCQHLVDLGIDCVHHNPEVGQNVEEIILSSMLYLADPPTEYKPGAFLTRYYQSTNYTGTGDNMELSMGNFYSGDGFSVIFQQLGHLRLGTSGSVQIKENNFWSEPIITLNLWADDADLDPLVDQLKFVRELMATAPLGFVQEISPGELVLPANATDLEIKAYLKENVMAGIHYTGSCAMHKVVDERLRVIGVDNIRVLDNSIIPSAPGTHSTSSAANLIGKVGARLIMEDN